MFFNTMPLAHYIYSLLTIVSSIITLEEFMASIDVITPLVQMLDVPCGTNPTDLHVLPSPTNIALIYKDSLLSLWFKDETGKISENGKLSQLITFLQKLTSLVHFYSGPSFKITMKFHIDEFIDFQKKPISYLNFDDAEMSYSTKVRWNLIMQQNAYKYYIEYLERKIHYNKFILPHENEIMNSTKDDPVFPNFKESRHQNTKLQPCNRPKRNDKIPRGRKIVKQKKMSLLPY